MTIVLKGGFTTEDPRLDALPEWDERNNDYLIRDSLDMALPLRAKTWYLALRLDQGQEGACVGFGWSHEGAASPYRIPSITNATAQAFYKEAQEHDPWAGSDYSGTSMLAGAKVARLKGWITGYRWAPTEPELAMALAYEGPAVLSLPWYEGMSRPDANGFIAPTGRQTGRHCIAVNVFALMGGYYRLPNSWGRDWGENGTAKLRRADMAKLLDGGGEACIPVGRAFPNV